MVPRFSETPIDSAKGRPPDFGIKLSEFLKFIGKLDIEIPYDVLPELPEEERKIYFTEEEIKKIERRLSAARRLFEHFFRRFFDRPQETTKEEISKTIIEVITKLNIKPNEWKKYLVNYPFLFFISFQTITENIEKAVELLGIRSKEDYVKAALKYPNLFTLSPDTINRNVENAAKLLGINKEDYVKAALKYPNLFALSPNTINVKFDLYNMFIEESPENILNYLLNYPIYFTYAPERIMAFYVISKLAGIQLNFDILTKNLNSFAKKILSPDRYQNIFEPLYDYFRKLFERRRKIKRKVGNVEGEAKAIRSHAQRIIEYFGPKEQISLTKEQIQKITELAQKIKNKKFRKESI